MKATFNILNCKTSLLSANQIFALIIMKSKSRHLLPTDEDPTRWRAV